MNVADLVVQGGIGALAVIAMYKLGRLALHRFTEALSRVGDRIDVQTESLGRRIDVQTQSLGNRLDGVRGALAIVGERVARVEGKITRPPSFSSRLPPPPKEDPK